jgi:hypothetical protein
MESTNQESSKGRRSRDQVIDMLTGRAGLRARIDAKCAECIYDPHQTGSWRAQVAACTSLSCPLYPVRPGVGREKVRDAVK